MKLKSILCMAFAVCMAFTACTQEEPIDQGGKVKEGIPTTLDITVSTEMVTTKAGVAATTKEMEISNLAIAIYKKNGAVIGDLLAFEYVSEPTETTDKLHEGRKAYEISGLAVETGDIQILAVANSTLTQETIKAEIDKGYAAAKANLKEAVLPAGEYAFSFDGSDLVKFADEPVSISLKNTSIHLELTQLAARVDVLLNFKQETTATEYAWIFDVKKFEVTGINSASGMFLGEYSPTSYTYNSESSSTVYNGDYTNPFPSISTLEDKESLGVLSFYTYERTTSASQPLSIIFEGELYNEAEETTKKTKKYRIDLNPVYEKGNEHKTTHGIIHGHVYEVSGLIDVNSNLITFTTRVAPWLENQIVIEAEISKAYYLFVSEHNVQMPYINHYEIDYATNMKTVEREIISVTYKGYTKGGVPFDGTYESHEDYYPQINLSGGIITVDFDATPINYVPTKIVVEITATATEEDGSTTTLTETVNITHYPTPYVEATLHYLVGRGTNAGTPIDIPEGTPNRKYGGVPVDDLANYGGANGYKRDGGNYNSFVVTSIASGEFMIGVSALKDSNDKTYTDTSEEANQLVSPKFVVASQLGTTNPISYATAQERCKRYTEYNGIYSKTMTAGNWRIPTEAEIIYMAKLQLDPNSAISGLLEGSRYWSALGTHVDMGDAKAYESNNDQYVRCVCDVY